MRRIDDSYLPIPREDLPNLIGKAVHVEEHGTGAHYILQSVSGGMAQVYHRTSARPIIVRVERLRYTRAHEGRAKGAKDAANAS